MSAAESLHPKQFIDLYHGTGQSSASEIRANGLRPGHANIAGVAGYTLTSNRDYAQSHADRRFGVGDVVQAHIPISQAKRYLSEPFDASEDGDGSTMNYALRRHLPPEHIR